MNAALYLAGIGLRHGWRSLLGITLLVAVVGGLVLGGAAGALRTASVIDRMVAHTGAVDVLVNPALGDQSALTPRRIAALPQVAQAAAARPLLLLPPDPTGGFDMLDDSPLFLATDGRALWTWSRPIITDGRMPDAGAADEVLVQKSYADAHGLVAGDTIPGVMLTRRGLQQLFAAADHGSLRRIAARPGLTKPVDLVVAGVGVTLEGVVYDEGFDPTPLFTGPALYRELGRPPAGFWGGLVKLRDPAELGDFQRAVQNLVPGEKVVFQTRENTQRQVERGTTSAAAALALFSGVVGGLGLILIVQAVSRRLRADSRTSATLAALGASRRLRCGAAVLGLTPAVAVGAVLGSGIGYGMSWFTPVGPGRVAEVSPGFAWDPLLAWGAVALFAVVVAAAVWPAWTAAAAGQPRAQRPSTVARWLAARGAPYPLTTGIRFAVEGGGGERGAASRATIVAAATGAALAAASVTFAASIGQVVSQPHFRGINWDGAVAVGAAPGAERPLPGPERTAELFAGQPEVSAAGVMHVNEVEVNGVTVPATAFSNDALGATLAEGRAPDAADEAALGSLTMAWLDVAIGDRVRLRAPGYAGQATIVGRAVLPGVGLFQGSDKAGLGVGVVLAPEAIVRPAGDRGPGSAPAGQWAVVYRVSGESSAEEVADRVAYPAGVAGTIQRIGLSADTQSLAALQNLPAILAACVVLLIAVTVAHALLLAVRGRRFDLAVLRALGAGDSAIRWTGVSHGASIAAVALLVGLPLGISLGRWSWVWVATAFGTVPTPVIPIGGIVALAAAVLVMAGAAGLIPTQRALRIPVGRVLNAE